MDGGVQLSAMLSDHEVELPVTDNTLDGVSLSASIDVKVEMVDGNAIVNDQYALPVGLAHIEMKADVKQYVLSAGTKSKRHSHKTLHDMDIGVAARVAEDPVRPNTFDITLVVTEFDGVSREIEHATVVSVVLDENDIELERTVDSKSNALSVNDKTEAAKHPLISFDQTLKEDIEKDYKTVYNWFTNQWHSGMSGRLLVLTIFAGVTLILFTMLCVCLRCCGSTQMRNKKGANYRKNLSMGPVHVMVAPTKFKNVKYSPLKNES